MIIMPIRMDGVTPNAPTQPQPSSPAPKEAQSGTTNENQMKNANTSDGQAVAGSCENTKSSLETAVDQIDAVRSSIKAAATDLHQIISLLKQAQREQRGTEREIKSVRSTLQNLQRVRI